MANNNQDFMATIVSQTDDSGGATLTDEASTINEKNSNPIYESADKDDIYEEGFFLSNKPSFSLKMSDLEHLLSYYNVGDKFKFKVIAKVDYSNKNINKEGKSSMYQLKIVAIKI